MSEAITIVVGALGDVVAIFAEPPLSYVVGIMIVGAAVMMIASLFNR